MPEVAPGCGARQFRKASRPGQQAIPPDSCDLPAARPAAGAASCPLVLRLVPVLGKPALAAERTAAESPDFPKLKSEARRVGQECVKSVRSRGWPDHYKTNKTN